ncbi:Na+-driven multidrug efflux pump [Anaerospora hongkongensis]|uniref:Na+-driven multidrug efflux pump n=1 Tax=Anaerospora hongkongensis TaxID=244830 RepID=A0A4R1PZ74_9FIRM|nr:oligosaccharide flippase family protein [Anaerospora hongkongensis]TCL36066.1 Na+-driven multidrug efflux pump [Anaerospora hongkongensis]
MFLPFSIFSRFTSNALWSLSGAIFLRGSTLLATIFVARIIGKEAFGEYAIVQNTLMMIATITGVGLSMTGTKYVAGYTDINKLGRIISLIICTSLISGLLGSSLIYFLSDIISEKVLQTAKLKDYFFIGATAVVFNVIISAITGVLSGLNKFKDLAIINLIVGFSTFSLLLLLSNSYGVYGAIIGFVLSAIINCLLCLFFLYRYCAVAQIQINFMTSWTEYSILTKFSLPTVIGNVVVMLAVWISNILIVKQTVGGYSELAIINAALQWQNAILFVPNTLTPVILTALSKSYTERSYKDYSNVIKLSFYVTCLVSGCICLILFFFADSLMGLYGTNFSIYGLVLKLIIISSFLISINNVIGQILASIGTMWTGFMFNLCWAMVFSISSFYGIKYYGLYGLAWAYILSYFIHSVWQFSFIYFKIKKSNSDFAL